MQKNRIADLIFKSVMTILLIVFCCVCIPERVNAVEYIENGYGSISDKDQVKSFASAYGWDEDLFLAKEWGGSDGKKYSRQIGHQVQALSDTYAAVSRQLLSDDELETESGTTTYREKTERFLKDHYIDKGVDTTNTMVSGGKGGAAVAAVASSQIGVVENPPYSNRVEYNEYFGASGQEWCAYFVSWCAAKCGYDSNTFSATGSTGVMYSNLEAMGCNMFRITDTCIYGGGYTPYPGDVVLYTTNGLRSGTEHCGLVLYSSENSITVVEGNTTGDGKIRGNEGVTTRTLTASYCNASVNPAFGRNIVIFHVNWGGAEYDEYFDYIKQASNLNDAASYGIYSCLESLSSFNSTKRDIGTGLFGIAQWDSAGTQKLKDWCKKNNRSYIDTKTQIDYLLYDLRNNKSLWTALEGTAESESGAYNAVKLVSKYFGLDEEKQIEIGNMSRQYWLIYSKTSH